MLAQILVYREHISAKFMYFARLWRSWRLWRSQRSVVKVMKVAELRAELTARGLDCKGIKAQLAAKLEKCLEEEKVQKTLTSFGKNFSTRKLAMSLWRVWRRSTRSSTRSTSSLSRLTSHSMPRRIRSKRSQQLASLGKYFNIVHINSSQLEGVLKQREAAVEEF